MNERLVEDWLTKASERSYQTPFAQSLLADGMQVLRVAHGSHEHGKDIIAIDQKGAVHAYQLKDGDLDLKAWEKGAEQVRALVEAQVEHPALSGQPPHQPWLVFSGKTSMPAEDRIRVHNLGWKKRRFKPLKTIGGAQLLAKFNGMASNFWPQAPEDSRNLLTLYLAEGKENLDRAAFAKLISNILRGKGGQDKSAILRRLSAANLFASYALSPYIASKNHWEVLQGWMITAAHIAWAAEAGGVSLKAWRPTFRLAMGAASLALDNLVDEALENKSLRASTLTESDELTRSRCTICAGAIAAKLLVSRWSKTTWDLENSAQRKLEELFTKGRLFLWGESAVAFFWPIVWAWIAREQISLLIEFF